MKDIARCSVMGSTGSGSNGRNVMSFMSRRPTVTDGGRGLGPGTRPSHLRSDSMPSRSSSAYGESMLFTARNRWSCARALPGWSALTVHEHVKVKKAGKRKWSARAI